MRSAEVVAANIMLEWDQLFTIRGVLPDFGAAESQSTMLTIRVLDGVTAIAPRAVTIRPNGEFAIGGVARGTYLLQTLTAKNHPRSDRIMAATVQVDGSNVEGVVLSAVEMIEVSGQITLDGNQGSLRPSMIRISAVPANLNSPNAHQVGGVVDTDFRFQFRTWPGLTMVFVTIANPAWHVKSVKMDGRDVTDSGVDFSLLQGTPNLAVELTSRAPVISGRIVRADGRTDDASFVVVFAKDEALWTTRGGRYVTSARPDQSGEYLIRGLPEGQYYVIATDKFHTTDLTDVELLRSLAARADIVTVRQAEAKRLDLRVQQISR